MGVWVLDVALPSYEGSVELLGDVGRAPCPPCSRPLGTARCPWGREGATNDPCLHSPPALWVFSPFSSPVTARQVP